MNLPPGTRLGPYEILDPIGAGGMGEVYRARDTRLRRCVAIKVLPGELSGNSVARARFEREARAVASLDHPNVLNLHDFGVEGGVCYAVTELLEGETLRQRLSDGPLPWRTAADLATAMVQGVAAAHARGIVHRDLKPENVFLTSDGRVKVLDFGLARLDAAEEAGAGHLDAATETGALLGTAGYMAPEQVRGERADSRSDIFSVGCVLYEMVTGERAFHAGTFAETLVAILREEPPAVLDRSPECPVALARIVDHCLAKRPEDRIQSARDVVIALSDIAGGATSRLPGSSHRIPRIGRSLRVALAAAAALALLALWLGLGRRSGVDSLAVLPFRNASTDGGAEYLSEGLSENLLNRFSRLSDLRVPARSTVLFALKGGTDPRKAGRDLRVSAVLSGQVRRRGDDLVVDVELLDVAGGAQLWGERFERKTGELLPLTEQIVRDVAKRLRVRMTKAQAGELSRRATSDPEAYDLYLQGRYHWNKRTGEEIVRSIEFFENAVRRDPRFAPAFAGLADAYDLLAFYGGAPPKDLVPRARESAIRALELDESDAEAHAVLADVRYQFEWDWPGAEHDFRRAIALDPGSATAHQWYSNYLSLAGRFDQSFAEIETARRLEPLNLIIRTDEGLARHWAGNDERAKALLESTLRLEPEFGLGHLYLSLVEVGRNSLSDAMRDAEKASRLLEGEPDPIALLGYVSALAGRRTEAEDAMKRLDDLSRRRFVDALPMAVLAMGLEDRPRALTLLERAYAEKSGRLVYLRVERAFDPLRNDPRFQGLVERLRFPAS